jgi:dCTP deaminase
MLARGVKKYCSIAKREKIKGPNDNIKRGVLSKNDIIDFVEGGNLIITPLLNPERQIANSAVDIRLGTEFIIMKKRAFSLFDPHEYKEYDRDIIGYQERIRIGYKKPFTIHPNSLVLASSMEFISLPENLMCYVIGKSSWGRLGLIIATATKIDPGFKGCITLEIVNHGEVPLKLYPGLPIAQIVIHYMSSPTRYDGRYSIAIGPEFPKLGEKNPDWLFWYPD